MAKPMRMANPQKHFNSKPLIYSLYAYADQIETIIVAGRNNDREFATGVLQVPE
jgi:hypothetical protein